jgi:hypothetical protein
MRKECKGIKALLPVKRNAAPAALKQLRVRTDNRTKIFTAPLAVHKVG